MRRDDGIILYVIIASLLFYIATEAVIWAITGSGILYK